MCKRNICAPQAAGIYRRSGHNARHLTVYAGEQNMSISGLGSSFYLSTYAQQLPPTKEREDKTSELHQRQSLNESDPKQAGQSDVFADALNNALQSVQVVTGAAAVQASNVETDINAATDESGPLIENIKGVNVIVGNHALDNVSGRSLLRTMDADQSADFLELARQFAQDGNVTPGMEVISSEAVTKPEGVPMEMDVNMYTLANDWSTYLEMDVDSKDPEYLRRVEAYMDLVGVERELKEQYGDDVKLVYSHRDNGYIMLTQDDLHYDEMASAEDGVQAIIDHVRRDFVDAEVVRDALAPYGYRV
ncbi:hypothetical Protein YC6258_05194 [Gynuella sunshinyii YC6258]|uniref:Uncharacterized protein n=2 Tax=Gynuella sunshinyii TaxID=1445505 RepID=A0A0C5W3M7_9GAMM|nr:hypothetical Protein YC6258_05194 [Gynuella sunshinyii YC6258]